MKRPAERYWCVDCEVDTRACHEYYMVLRAIWQAFGVGRGMLCLGCLERRLGRFLTPADFDHGLPVNQQMSRFGYTKMSTRLLNRLGYA